MRRSHTIWDGVVVIRNTSGAQLCCALWYVINVWLHPTHLWTVVLPFYQFELSKCRFNAENPRAACRRILDHRSSCPWEPIFEDASTSLAIGDIAGLNLCHVRFGHRLKTSIFCVKRRCAHVRTLRSGWGVNDHRVKDWSYNAELRKICPNIWWLS